MTIKNILLASFVACILIGSASCRSKRTVVNNSNNTNNRQDPNGQRRTPAQMIAQMDANKDGRLALAETKGRLRENFSTIDTDNNGFISLQELKAAPRPPRDSQRGSGNRMR